MMKRMTKAEMQAARKKEKAALKAEAVKKAKRKKIITVTVCISLVVAIAAIVVVVLFVFDESPTPNPNSNPQSDSRVFSDDVQSVTLRNDSTFTAQGCSYTKNGTYVENTANGITTVSFTYEGQIENGSLAGNVITIPNEWDEGHGHNPKLSMN